MSTKKFYKTLRVRVKDKHCAKLSKKARAVNFVWNYINELSHKHIAGSYNKKGGVFLSAFDIQKYTKGANKELGLHSQTLQMVGAEYTVRRKQFKKAKLNWRKSRGVRRSLGWIPLNGQSIKWKNGQIFHNGEYYGVFDSHGLSQYKFRAGNFSEDSRGRWYFNVVVEVEVEPSQATSQIGIDLGFKAAANDSDGNKLVGREYRALEKKLATAQRARNKRQVRTINAKIKNRRLDRNHKYSTQVANNNALVVVGNVSSQAMVKTKGAKSALDAGWHQIKTMLEYKCAFAGNVFVEVNEAYTTQTCSVCKNRTGPKGQEGLGIREWTCSSCGALLDRDTNAATNILGLGLESLVEESPAFRRGE